MLAKVVHAALLPAKGAFKLSRNSDDTSLPEFLDNLNRGGPGFHPGKISRALRFSLSSLTRA